MFQSKENQRWTALIQSCFSLKQRCSALKQLWIFQFWTALIQRKSELISADVYHVLWIGAEKRQNYETALFSADYLWDFNPGIYESEPLQFCNDWQKRQLIRTRRVPRTEIPCHTMYSHEIPILPIRGNAWTTDNAWFMYGRTTCSETVQTTF